MLSSPGPLILIGTVHQDCAGEGRLLSVLEQIEPSVVTLELSPTSLHYRQQHGALLRRRLERIVMRLAAGSSEELERIMLHPAIQDIHRLLEIPFEHRAAEAYTRPRGVPLELIDLPQVAEQKVRRIQDELITLHNLRMLLGVPMPALRKEDYSEAVALIERETSPSFRRAFLLGRRGEEGIGPRDRSMAEVIRKCCRERSDRPLVHIGGWVHLIDDPDGETLYSLLADLQPLRMLLGRVVLDPH